VQQQPVNPYPVDLTVDYQDAGRNRLTVGFGSSQPYRSW
jgi:hypothetical protein